MGTDYHFAAVAKWLSVSHFFLRSFAFIRGSYSATSS